MFFSNVSQSFQWFSTPNAQTAASLQAEKGSKPLICHLGFNCQAVDQYAGQVSVWSCEKIEEG